MLSPFLPNPIYEFENVISFRKAWEMLPSLVIAEPEIESKFDAFALS